MKIPEPIFIGYFPKKTMGKQECFANSPVQEVCSVSNCMSEAPVNWFDEWKHNDWGCYDSEAIAWGIIRDDPALYDMYAYRIFPFMFGGDGDSAVLVELTASAHLAEYEFLGYDPVSRESGTTAFCHSPLSCNAGFEQYPVNRFFLIDNLEEAWRITAEIAKEAKDQRTWEPGPYCLCEVYRKKKQ
jgi:hypothetical protein